MLIDNKATALIYAQEYKWHVFPCHSIKNNQCTCGNTECSNPGKHPRTTTGFKDATLDPEQISRWWTNYPDANIAIATGASKLLVVDVDPRNGGEEALYELQKEHGAFPNTSTVSTGGGGWHYYFKLPHEGFKPPKELAKGIDLKGDGGYVIAHPSTHISGDNYNWIDEARPKHVGVAELPPAYLELMFSNKRPESLQDRSGDGFFYEGERNNKLTSLAGSLHARGLNDAQLESQLLVTNQSLCKPPLQEFEVQGIAKSVAGYESDDQVIDTRRPLKWITVKELIDETSEEPDWLIEGYIAPNVITQVAGKVKVGKSTLIGFMLKSLLTGSPFLGTQKTRKSNVAYLTEESKTTYRYTVVEQAKIKEEHGLRILPYDHTDGRDWAEICDWAVRDCIENEIGVLVVDTIPQWAGIQGDAENHSGSAMTAMNPLIQARGQGLAVIVVRHNRKGDGDISDSGRGSSAWGGTVDLLVDIKDDSNSQDNQRTLEALGRLPNIPRKLLIELNDGSMISLGSEVNVKFLQTKNAILDLLPQDKDSAMTEKDIIDGTESKRATVKRVLAELVENNLLLRERGAGVETDSRAFGFWLNNVSTLKKEDEQIDSSKETDVFMGFPKGEQIVN